VIVFARTRWPYDSYQDFWRLVELSGFPVVWLDEIDLTADVTYIFTPHNGEFNQLAGLPVEPPAPGMTWHPARPRSWRERKCRLVWWMLERFDDGNPASAIERVESMLGFVDAAWVSDRWVASLHPRLTHVVLGGHPGLGRDPDPIKIYDYAHISYAWGRREALYAAIRARGLIEAPTNIWGPARAAVLAQTRLMVSAHQYPAATIAPLRFAIAAAHSLPLLTEAVTDPYPHVLGMDLAHAEYHVLPDAVAGLLRDQERRERLGAMLRHRLCVEWTFRRGVEEAVARLETR
jgi:hypothetical protein